MYVVIKQPDGINATSNTGAIRYNRYNRYR